MQCPTCHGDKFIIGIFSIPYNKWPIEMECIRCNGTGEVPIIMKEWIKEGSKLREERIKKGITLRQRAEFLRLEPSKLCAMEQGRIDPSSLIAADIKK